MYNYGTTLHAPFNACNFASTDSIPLQEDANVPEDVADILKNILKEVRKDRPMKQRSISQFGASVVRSFRQKSQRIRHESSSEPTRTQT